MEDGTERKEGRGLVRGERDRTREVSEEGEVSAREREEKDTDRDNIVLGGL